ncbi:MAG: FAD-binding protein, partial [Rhodobacteraceae bacterium]|nr:FAD-binding protein [Paracoccaceae bacterium]
MRPETEAELAEMISSASGPVCVRGGGTRGVNLNGTMLETGGLSGVTLYEPGSLTLVAQAGTPLVEIEAALDAEGQRLAFEPMDHRGLM